MTSDVVSVHFTKTSQSMSVLSSVARAARLGSAQSRPRAEGARAAAMRARKG